MFAQVDGEVGDIELVARHDEGYAMSNQARTVVWAQCRGDENNNGVDSGANQAKVLCDVGGRGTMVCGDKEDATPSCNSADADPVRATYK